MKFWKLSLLALGVFSVQACAETKDKQKEKGWVQLFNGKDLSGWVPKIAGHKLGDNFRDTWRVEGGLLKVRYDQYETFDDLFGHLFYEAKPFSHYHLRIEYRFVGEQVEGGAAWARRNNGVMYHCQDPATMSVDQKFPVSLEYQLLGGNGKDERSTSNLCTPGTHVVIDGELIKKHVVPSSSKTFHGDEWVTAELKVWGSERAQHIVDGEIVMEYTQLQYDPADADAKKLIQNDQLLLDKGYISIQAESAPIDIRKIELLEMDPEKSASE